MGVVLIDPVYDKITAGVHGIPIRGTAFDIRPKDGPYGSLRTWSGAYESDMWSGFRVVSTLPCNDAGSVVE